MYNRCLRYILLNHTFMFAALQVKLNEEKNARQKAEVAGQEKERQMSMLSVDYRQIEQKLHKVEAEHRQEVEKVLKIFLASLDSEVLDLISSKSEFVMERVDKSVTNAS